MKVTPEHLLRCITAHWKSKSYPPTVRALQDATGLSISTVWVKLRVLERRGELILIDGRPVPVKMIRLMRKL